MHPVIARATGRRATPAPDAGTAVGAERGVGWTATLPDEIDNAWADSFRMIPGNAPVSPVIAPAAPLANLDHPVGTPRPTGDRGAAMPSRTGGVAPWTEEALNGAHTVILRPRRIAQSMHEPWGGVTAGLDRTPPPDIANGEGCSAYGSLAQYAPSTGTFGA